MSIPNGGVTASLKNDAGAGNDLPLFPVATHEGGANPLGCAQVQLNGGLAVGSVKRAIALRLLFRFCLKRRQVASRALVVSQDAARAIAILSRGGEQRAPFESVHLWLVKAVSRG